MASDASQRIDAYIAKAAPFAQPICTKLRQLIHQADKRIEEDWKWGSPNFSLNGMLCSIGAFKQHVNLVFFRGALIKDSKKLFEAGAGKQLRTIRFTSVDDIQGPVIVAYLKEAVKVNEQGVRPAKQEVKVVVPAELKKALQEDKHAKAVFDGLAPSCQREYAEYIADAKKPETRERRLAKTLDLLGQGKSLNDKYRR
ncbi:MAG: DUF1801 domain-containing protein [Gemmataceae bacterium]